MTLSSNAQLPSAPAGDLPDLDPSQPGTMEVSWADHVRLHGAPALPAQAGTVLAGKFTLIQRIGQGGMGTVWLAQQFEPLQREVAVKLIRHGSDSHDIAARFEAERQALALMDHPNIATVLDGGETADGQPFFVMEWVKGIPITEFCDRHQLSPRERLALFIPVCEAVQHAHQRGIIHRDIKPSNVLVAVYDGRPVPKVIDFGVAKATAGAFGPKPSQTGFGTVIGTPEYMSPEQAQFDQRDVDTRTDVYALGVLLYELLTGSTPVDRAGENPLDLIELLRTVREVEPPRPSDKLGSSDTIALIASRRQLEPTQLTRLLRGELDCVVLKALEKDREHRYESAHALAQDVERYLAGEAVTAHPPSRTYRMRKFVRRNRGFVAAGLLIFAALLLGVLGTSLGLLQARRSQAIALEERNKARTAAAAEAQANAKATQRLAQWKRGNQLLIELFADLDLGDTKEKKRSLEASLADKLLAASELLKGESLGEPLEVAVLQNRLGQTLQNLGFPDKALQLYAEARSTHLQLLGPDHANTMSCSNNLATAYREVGKPDLALPLYLDTYERRKRVLGADHKHTLLSMNNLAVGYKYAGKPELALPLYEEAYQVRKAKLGPDHADTLRSMGNLAVAYSTAKQPERAIALQLESLRLKRARYGPTHLDTLASMANLASAYRAAGQRAAASALYEEALPQMRATLTADHPLTISTLSNMASNYHALDETASAIRCIAEAAQAVEKRKFAHEHAEAVVRNAVQVYERAGLPDVAESWQRKLMLHQREKVGANSLPHCQAQLDLAKLLLKRDKSAEAEPLLLECHAGLKSLPDAPAAKLNEVADCLVESYTSQAKLDQAEKWRKQRVAAPPKNNE